MTDQQRIAEDIAQVAALMRTCLGAGGTTLAAALRRARHRLPRGLRAPARRLAMAEPLAAHPRLRLTLDAGALGEDARRVREHLESVDLADRRRGWWLGMLGALAFNMLAFVTLLIVFLKWRGLI
ncbi:MAG: hypothetical protein ACK5MY_16505 [Jhaorihella sp.]